MVCYNATLQLTSQIESRGTEIGTSVLQCKIAMQHYNRRKEKKPRVQGARFTLKRKALKDHETTKPLRQPASTRIKDKAAQISFTDFKSIMLICRAAGSSGTSKIFAHNIVKPDYSVFALGTSATEKFEVKNMQNTKETEERTRRIEIWTHRSKTQQMLN
jgi:hypothetical protein